MSNDRALPLALPAAKPAELSPTQDLANRRARLDLKCKSPLRGKFEQHDESDLALFRSANEPGLPL